MDNKTLPENLAEINATLKDYINVRFDLIKVRLLEKMTQIGTRFLSLVAGVVALFSFLIFIMFSFSFWYGQETGSLSEGFLISAGFFLLLIILVIIFRKKLFSNVLVRSLAKILFSDDED